MSVCVHEVERLQEMFDQLKMRWNTIHVPVPEAFFQGRSATQKEILCRLAWAFECASLAQHATYAHSYASDDGYISKPKLDRSPLTKGARLTDMEVADCIGNLLYNCVAQDGTDFCPAKVSELFDSLRTELYRKACHTPDYSQCGNVD